jgi:hypothetical protein
MIDMNKIGMDIVFFVINVLQKKSIDIDMK